jgi:proteasome accessory factor B
MDRAERLLDLVALLLNAEEPVRWEDIRDAFPDYRRASPGAALRKFERDKADLHDLGIPVSYVVIKSEDEEYRGYALDRSAYYLPDLRLQPEELAALYAAGSAALAAKAFPYRNDLAFALRKIGFVRAPAQPAAAPEPPPHLVVVHPQARDPDQAKKLEDLARAVGQRKRVQMTYHTMSRNEITRRAVDPYGLGFRRGAWMCVGWCHLRKDLRVFNVARIRALKLNAKQPRSPDFEMPADFRLEDHLARQPWEFHDHAPVEAVVRLLPGSEWLAERQFGRRAEKGRVRLTVTSVAGLARSVLGLSGRAVIESPREARQRMREMLAPLAKARA